MTDFPVVERPEQARCFACQGELGPHEASGYPHGVYRARCGRCGLFTYFDLED